MEPAIQRAEQEIQGVKSKNWNADSTDYRIRNPISENQTRNTGMWNPSSGIRNPRSTIQNRRSGFKIQGMEP